MADDQAPITVKNPEITATEPSKLGYRSFTFDAFKFSRDEYFVHIEWRQTEAGTARLRALEDQLLVLAGMASYLGYV